METVSHLDVDGVLYRAYSWPDGELFIDNCAFTDALPIGSYVD